MVLHSAQYVSDPASVPDRMIWPQPTTVDDQSGQIMSLTEQIDVVSNEVLEGRAGLDDALEAVERWLHRHVDTLDRAEQRAFSDSLSEASTNDDRSLVRSVLKLHATRLLYRYDTADTVIESPPHNDPNRQRYLTARDAFNRAIHASEIGINEARIDVAIANAHHLLGNIASNRRWLQASLNRLPDLAATDLVALAEAIPAPPLPRLNRFKRFGVRLLGLNLERLAARSQQNLVKIAIMQENQIVLLAHLVGTSFEAIRDRARAQRAFRIAAHLITRYWGMPHVEADQLLYIAEDLQTTEREAARILAQQALDLCPDNDADAACRQRAETILRH